MTEFNYSDLTSCMNVLEDAEVTLSVSSPRILTAPAGLSLNATENTSERSATGQRKRHVSVCLL